MAKDKEVAVVEPAMLPALRADYKFMALTNPEIIKENLGGDDLNPFDLDRAKFPSGGGIAWMLPTLSGKPAMAESIDGIIVNWRNVRTYWQSEFTGESTSPDCSSQDGECGLGDPGGTCGVCPLGQWGSGKNGGQACKAARLLFIMRKGSILPLVVPIPPTSVGIMKKFFMRLANNEIVYHGALVSLGLEQTKSKGGITYSQVVPAMVQQLQPEEAAMVQAYADTIKESLDKVSLDREDVEGAVAA